MTNRATAANAVPITYADLAGANAGQRPDLLNLQQGLFETPDGKLWSSFSDQLVAARNVVPTIITSASGASALVGPDGVVRLERNTYQKSGDYYKTSPGEVLIDTSAVGAAGFTMAGATNVKVDNASTVWWAGSSAVDVTNTGGSGATLNCTRTLSVARTALGVAPSMVVPIWVEDFTKINGITIRFSMGDATFTNNYSFNYGIGPTGAGNLKRNGWHLISIGASDWVSNGAPDWTTQTINAIRILYVNAPAQNNARIIIDDLLINNRAKAKVLLMTDRTFSEQYTFLRPLLNALKLRATFSITQSDIGQAGKMTEAQVNQLIADGHALCVRNPTAMNTLTEQQCVDAVAAEQAYIRATFGAAGAVGAKFLTYANGIYYPSGSAAGDMAVPNRVKNELGILGARTTDTTSQPNFMQLGCDALPPNIMVAPIIGEYTPNNSAADIIASIDRAIARSAAAVFFMHAPTHSSIVPQETVRAVYEHIASKKAAGLIDDVTWPEFYYGL